MFSSVKSKQREDTTGALIHGVHLNQAYMSAGHHEEPLSLLLCFVFGLMKTPQVTLCISFRGALRSSKPIVRHINHNVSVQPSLTKPTVALASITCPWQGPVPTSLCWSRTHTEHCPRGARTLPLIWIKSQNSVGVLRTKAKMPGHMKGHYHFTDWDSEPSCRRHCFTLNWWPACLLAFLNDN